MSRAILIVVTTAISLLPNFMAPLADAFTWGAALVGTRLLVVVDTRNSPADLVVESASFNATFLGPSGANLGTRNFELPANRLVPGKLHTFNYTALPSAASVQLSTIFADYRADGSSADGREISQNTSIDPKLQRGPVIVFPPLASRQQLCPEYARRASQQNARNLSLSCGYSGDQWQSSPEFHTQWCMGALPSDAETELVERDSLLRRCARMKMRSAVPK